MSSGGASDDAIVREVEEKLLGKLSIDTVRQKVLELMPAFHSGHAYDERHCKKMARAVKKALRKYEVQVGVYTDVSEPDGYRVHVTLPATLERITVVI